MKISVIDYGLGNVKSIMKALSMCEAEIVLTRDPSIILNSEGVVLPGVGAFSHGMAQLKENQLDAVIHDYVATDRPFLGICLGMQLLLDSSDEFGQTKGLGLVRGQVKKIRTQDPEYPKLPHISWNEIRSKHVAWNQTILDNVDQDSDVFFVHSYVADVDNDHDILSETVYSDVPFCSSIKKGNIYGAQFHPEKSGQVGLTIMNNFVRICKEMSHGK